MFNFRYHLSYIAFFLISPLYGSNEVSKGVKLLNEKLSNPYLKQLSATIEKHSKTYKVPWKVIVAILKVESNFDMKAVNYPSRDFGISQINAINMKYYKIDLGKQMTDLDYAIENTCKILSNLRKKYDTDSKYHFQWFTRYHSFSMHRRVIYYGLLKPHLKALEYKNE